MYRFCFAFENTDEIGYVSEKFFHALASGCVPVYMGASDIDLYLPAPNAVIHANDFSDAAALGRYLKVRIRGWWLWFWLWTSDLIVDSWQYLMLNTTAYWEHLQVGIEKLSTLLQLLMLLLMLLLLLLLFLILLLLLMVLLSSLQHHCCKPFITTPSSGNGHFQPLASQSSLNSNTFPFPHSHAAPASNPSPAHLSQLIVLIASHITILFFADTLLAWARSNALPVKSCGWYRRHQTC